MNLVFFVLIFLGSLGALAQTGASPFGEDPCADSSAREFFSILKDSYDKTDSTFSISLLKAQIKKCGKKTQDVLNVDESFLDSMAKESREKEFAKIKTNLEKASEYGEIKEHEKDFINYAKKTGNTDYESYLSQKKAQGLAAAANEKKSCSPVDMSKDMPPIRNQDSVGWCYAFTAADLLSYKTKKNISAADIALEDQNNWIDSIERGFKGSTAADFKGGWVDHSLKSMQKKGLCLETDLSSEDNSGGTFADSLRSLDSWGRASIAAKSRDCNNLYAESKRLFPGSTLSDLQEVVKTSSKRDFINNLREKSCKRIPAKYEVVTMTKQGFHSKIYDKLNRSRPEKDYAQALDEQLSSKNPVGVSIDANGFSDRRSPALTYDNSAPHAVSVVGRRFNESTGQCEYLLRNSYGAGCSGYDSTLECTKGMIWMPKPDLMSRTWGLSYVK
ncbi:C1 family peptidase [Bdellovibrio sp. HCB288]|uniref:C1 family peptidase n=1 Tax=Bdellovibrio sp. HCB288 TaxID=3394355 RepID=UPI0039B36DD9